MRLSSFGVLAFLAFSQNAFAEHPRTRLRNETLRDQITDQEPRALPCTELYCFAIDGHFFYRTIPQPREFLYYHGGYWVDSYIELNPSDEFSLNSRLAVLHPAASYGVVSTAEILPFIAVTWKENLNRYHLGDVDAQIRWLDLDRQTLGAGLTLEDKDMAGLLIELEGQQTRLRFVLDGTGGYMVEKDLWYGQFDLWNERLGIYTFSLNSIDTPHAFGLFSKFPLSTVLSLDSEMAVRRNVWGALLRLKANSSWKRLIFESSLQVRSYGVGFSEDITGQIDHDYIPIDYENRSFMISENIFSLGDGALAMGARLKLVYQFSSLWGIHLDLEPVHFDFKNKLDVTEVFYRSAVSFCPSVYGCGSLFVSNRALSSARDVVKNRPLLSAARHYGLDAHFSF